MQLKQEACCLCAWRENCQKKFSISGKDVRCPDFVRDLSIQKQKTGESQEEDEPGG
jgi:hypothetical protein